MESGRTYIYCRGKILPEDEAWVPVTDHGLLYGIGLFDTFRTFRGSPLLLEAHLARIRRGCRDFFITPGDDLLIAGKPDGSRFLSMISELLQRNGLEDAVFRYTITAGPAGAGLPRGPYMRPSEMLFIRPLPPPAPKEGVPLQLLSTRRNSPETPVRAKSLNYANSLLAWLELVAATDGQPAEGLLLNADGSVAEGTVSNIFLIREKALFTPPISAGILPGVTRATVMDLAKAAGIPAWETSLALADLEKAEAIFLTNSVRGFLPVRELRDMERHPLWRKASADHPLFHEIQSAYLSLAERRRR